MVGDSICWEFSTACFVLNVVWMGGFVAACQGDVPLMRLEKKHDNGVYGYCLCVMCVCEREMESSNSSGGCGIVVAEELVFGTGE